MNRHRSFAAIWVSALALGASGCHHKTVAYRQPPPPPVSASYPRATSASTRSSPSNTNVAAVPAAPDHASSAGTKELGKPTDTEVGMASWYGPPYNKRKAADGSVYDQNAMTAAHRTLPMGTMVRVTNLSTGQSAVVRITDRGPFVHGRIIDLSLAAAKATGLYRMGVAKVKVEAFAPQQRAGTEPAGRWCVQVGAFAKQADALKLQKDLLRRYATAKVIEFPGPTGHWVRINPATPDKAHATEVANYIHPKDPQVEPYIIRTN